MQGVIPAGRGQIVTGKQQIDDGFKAMEGKPALAGTFQVFPESG